MGLGCSWYVRFLIMCGFFWRIAFLDQRGFLSLYCGGTSNFTDSSNILWIPDSSYVTTGNATSVTSIEGITPYPFPLRFFPSSKPKSLNCYRLPVQNMSLVLVRPQFIYKNYDGLMNPPSFFVSLGTAIVTTVNLTIYDPWVEEFIWPVSKENLLFCLHPIPGGGHPVISSLELRPLPTGAYASGIGNSSNSLLRKRFRINCGYSNGSLRYPVDPYDRIWDPDQNYSPAHLSAGFNIPIQLDVLELKESPPVSVLQSARVLARKNILSYDFSVSSLGDYYIVMYFAGTLPVSSTFDVLVNREVVRSNYQVKNMEASAVFISRNRIDTLNITLRNISYYPQVNAIEIYEIIEIPMESSATQVSALQVIQQSTGFNLGWEGDPCYPVPWEHIGCEGNLVTSLEISDMDMRVISPTFSDLIYLKTLDLHNTSLSGEIKNLGSLQKLEILNLSFNKLTSFGSDIIKLVSLKFLDLQNNSLQGTVPESLGSLTNLHLLNLENNRLQGPLPQSLNKDSLEVRRSLPFFLHFNMQCPIRSTLNPDSTGDRF
ncbi:putative LRR receptor-like serine/threonine-protein kinase [Acorus calamus]|uniref:LRR receptor-like serine/threonine-protein kinase n=1 Tax=Acorus calamus TaxID=4465 RepID=A0AAV9CM19_ACOCL|nr:putative LRR receptor-like serine/threonine-protein kinase [Acorus calamus]